MKNKLVNTGVVLFAISAISMSIFAMNGQKKMAYFDYNKIYNDCELKKDLEADLEKVVGLRQNQLDSMQLELSFMSERIQNGQSDQHELDEFEALKGKFLMLQDRYEQENIRLKEEYFTQIRSSINEKSKEYAEENGYDYLFSAIGDGSLMYGEDNEDITNELMEFVNK